MRPSFTESFTEKPVVLEMSIRVNFTKVWVVSSSNVTGNLGNNGYKEVYEGFSCVGVEHVIKDPPLGFLFVTYILMYIVHASAYPGLIQMRPLRLCREGCRMTVKAWGLTACVEQCIMCACMQTLDQ